MSTMTETRRAVVYRRVSTRAQADERKTSLVEQQEHARRYCQEHELRVVGEPFTDVMRGKRSDRPEYTRMVRHVLDGGADVVVVQWLDRFGRNPREILRRVWELQEAGIAVVATDEDLKEEISLLVKAWSAGQESRRVAERTRDKFLAAAKQGTHFGRAPYGYIRMARIDPADPKHPVVWYEQEPAEAAAVRTMWRLSVEDNLGWKAIAARLGDLGYTPRTARDWSNQTVRGILRNPALVGAADYHAAGELVLVENVFPAILTRDEWDRLQTRLAIRREALPQRKGPGGRTHTSDYLLSGTLRCGSCQAPMVGSYAYIRKRAPQTGHYLYRRYVCSSWNRNRKLCLDGRSHSAERVDAAVLDYLGQFSDPERVRALLTASGTQRVAGAADELRVVDRDLADLERDFLRDRDRLDRGVFDESDFVRSNAARRERRTGLEVRRAELSARVEAADAVEATIQAVPARVRSFLADIEGMEIRKAKAVLQTMLSAAYVYRDGRIELEFRT